MAYIKNTWVDREGVTRYFETVDEDGALILTPDYAQVTEIGTPVNADNMNHIEDGIEDHENRITVLEGDNSEISILPVFSANSGNVDENGNADLLYLPEMGDIEIPWQNPVVSSATEYGSITWDRGDLLYLVDGKTDLVRIDGGTYTLTWEFPKDKRILINQIKVYWGAWNGVSASPDWAKLFLYKNGELVGEHQLTIQFVTDWITDTFTKTECDKIVFQFDGHWNSDVFSRIGEIQLLGTEIITVSTSTQAFFKVGGNYPKLVATSTEKTFEKSYLEPITAETNGTYNVFISETENPYALTNNIYRQKTEPNPKFVQPILTANGTMGGDSFAVEASSVYAGASGSLVYGEPYYAFDNNNNTAWHGPQNAFPQSITFYNPKPLNVTNLKITNWAYTTNTGITSGVVYGSHNNIDWVELTKFTNSVITPNQHWNIDLTSNKGFYKYYKIQVDTSSYSYAVIGGIDITATIPTANTNDVWLNTAIQPYKAYKFNGTEWEEFSDVPIGSMVVSGGIITSVETFDYNLTFKKVTSNMPSNKYIDLTLGASGSTYTAPANGWLVFCKAANAASQYIQLNGTITSLGYRNNMLVGGDTPANGYLCYCYMPMAKGQSTAVYYNAGGDTMCFRFVYAEGEV